MARPSPMRWSARSQELLCDAVSDADFVQRLRTAGITDTQVKYWANRRDVPVTHRGIVRGSLEDWAYRRDLGRASPPVCRP